jgi:hypothetical protein
MKKNTFLNLTFIAVFTLAFKVTSLEAAQTVLMFPGEKTDTQSTLMDYQNTTNKIKDYGGMIPYTYVDINGTLEPIVLLSKEEGGKNTGEFCDLGGGVDPNSTLLETVVDETYQESAQLLKIPKDDIKKNSYFWHYDNQKNNTPFKGLTAFYKINHIPSQTLNTQRANLYQQHLKNKNLMPWKYVEKSDYTWVFLDSLLKEIQKNNGNKVTVDIYQDNGTVAQKTITLRSHFVSNAINKSKEITDSLFKNAANEEISLENVKNLQKVFKNVDSDYIETFQQDVCNVSPKGYAWQRFQGKKITSQGGTLTINYDVNNIWIAGHLFIDPLQSNIDTLLTLNTKAGNNFQSVCNICEYDFNAKKIGSLVKTVALPTGNTFQKTILQFTRKANQGYIMRILQQDYKKGGNNGDSLEVNHLSLTQKNVNNALFNNGNAFEKIVSFTQLKDKLSLISANDLKNNEILLLVDVDHTVLIDKKFLNGVNQNKLNNQNFIPVEKDISNIIKDIRKLSPNQKLRILGMTDRTYKNNLPQTEEASLQLKALNIDISRQFFKAHNGKTLTNNGIFDNGVIYAANQDQGKELDAFLKLTGYNPRLIVMVSRHKQDLQNAEKVTSNKNIPYLGLKYVGHKNYLR